MSRKILTAIVPVRAQLGKGLGPSRVPQVRDGEHEGRYWELERFADELRSSSLPIEQAIEWALD
jgi:hypothetical protein